MKFLLVPLLIIGMFISFAAALLAILFINGSFDNIDELKALISPKVDSAQLSEELLMREDKLDSLFRQVEGYRVFYDERLKILREKEDSLNVERTRVLFKADSLQKRMGAKAAGEDSAIQELRDENLANLAKYYGAMKPAKAAEILKDDGELSEEMGAGIISRLAPAKAGKIMTSMDPAYAGRITKIMQNLQ